MAAIETTTRTALLAGATGLVGRELLQLLLLDTRYSAVHCVGRRAPTLPGGLMSTKLVTHIVDFADAAQLAALPACDDVYIALGSTIRTAGSKTAFKAIDLYAVVALAQANIAQPAIDNVANNRRIGVVSAMGADAKSSVFYNHTKAEMEAAVAKLGYTSVSIARPSMLAGDRDALGQPARKGEQIGLKIMLAIGSLIPANYKAIEVADVAKGLHRMVTQGRKGTRIALSGELRKLAQAA